ncbi:tRNA-specific adenosine deaminase [Syntrophotalea acetylenivorans]|uniref:tRNA-specific adenosine deaminase n=1 Tax=Syntrophotalea acetylenivorans TaxID=1842532 RepID=A0A1L3GQ83_9BACT|nr:nucleoside deaminase [Syntrophotalea acetylenivorans]APG28087.1 tRNA-specific adenosine deaminase [Syntrophotalea acetylenivorans]
MQKVLLVSFLFSALLLAGGGLADEPPLQQSIAELEARIVAYVPDKRFRDDVFGLVVVKDAIVSLKAGSGGIGACLVDGKTGEVVERGRNRQYSPYFRSDMHAEMDLLNRYEDRLQKKGGGKSNNDPRRCGDLILFTSTEPCPMCLTRIINSGIQRMYWINSDADGGMAQRLDQMPPFWQRFAAGRDFRQAECSPKLRRIAEDLFRHSVRSFVGEKE